MTHNDFTIVADNFWYLSKWRHFGAPQFDCPPKRLVWIRHFVSVVLCDAAATISAVHFLVLSFLLKVVLNPIPLCSVHILNILTAQSYGLLELLMIHFCYEHYTAVWSVLSYCRTVPSLRMYWYNKGNSNSNRYWIGHKRKFEKTKQIMNKIWIKVLFE